LVRRIVTVLLQKTEKARVELRPGMRTLGQRERTILLLADGSKALDDFQGLFDGEGGEITRALIRDGFLAPAGRAPFSPNRSGVFSISTGVRAADLPPPAAPAVAPPAAKAPAVAADSFEGKRSLATTRMFLFDLVERMFARRDPAKANLFREALRQATDRASMLAASREMISEIELVAGAERADSISERIAMLLPPDPAG
jgi:hypothetical protein